MADEIKKKFQEIQEQKHGKKEIQVDEFEWIEVSYLFPNLYRTMLTVTLSAQ